MAYKDLVNQKEIILSECRGIYLPQNFIEETENVEGWTYNISNYDIITLKNGPDDEWYWQAWENMLNNAYFTYPDGTKGVLYQDGDLFVLPEGTSLEEEEEEKPIIARESTWDYDDQDGSLSYEEYHVVTIETWQWSDELGRYELVNLIEKETGEDIPFNEADYIRDGAVDIPELETEKLTGTEERRIHGVSSVDWFFNNEPGIYSEEIKEKIEAGEAWLTVEFNHDEKTASWYFEERNCAWTSHEDDYYSCLDAFEELGKVNHS